MEKNSWHSYTNHLMNFVSFYIFVFMMRRRSERSGRHGRTLPVFSRQPADAELSAAARWHGSRLFSAAGISVCTQAKARSRAALSAQRLGKFVEKTLGTTVVESVLSGPLIRTAADRGRISSRRRGGGGVRAMGKGRGTRGNTVLPIIVPRVSK